MTWAGREWGRLRLGGWVGASTSPMRPWILGKECPVAAPGRIPHGARAFE